MSGGETTVRLREKFRDDARRCQFELFRNSVLTAYVSYTMRAGVLRLHRTVVLGAFDGEQV